MAAPAPRFSRHRSPQGSFDLVRRPPDPRVRGLVRELQDFREWTPGPLRRREPPSGDIVVIVDLGGGWRLPEPDDPPGAGERYGSFVAGLGDRAGAAEHDGEARAMQVNLTPPGARALLGIPLRELAHRVVALEDVLGPEAVRLAERLEAAPGWRERLALLEQALLERAADAPLPRPDVAWAWRRLEQTGGRLPVSALAEELGCSRRHLTARFHEELGLPPKAFGRLLRFRRAADLMTAPDAPSLAEIAAACGYADQAHFNRDFRSFAGVSPGELLARRLPGGGGVLAG